MIWRALVFIDMGWLIGFADGHRVVARECERLGAFYVGPVVFDCRARAGGE